MARPKKETVDYFPHMATSGKTLYILENSFGNNGYAFWFKLLELLASTDGHVIDTNNMPDWKFLVAKTLVEEDIATEILDMLSDLSAIDTELWKNRIIWCQNLVDNVEDVYKKRRTKKPEKPKLNNTCDEKAKSSIVTDTETKAKHINEIVSDSGNRQSKVKETKGNEIKGNYSNTIPDVTDPLDKNVFQIFQENFGIPNGFVNQSLVFWEEESGKELLVEAMKRAAINSKPFSYAEGILKSWDKENIKTIEQVKAKDVSHSNNKKSYSNFKGTQKKEALPDWIDQEQPTEETYLDEEAQKKFNERLERFRKGSEIAE